MCQRGLSSLCQRGLSSRRYFKLFGNYIPIWCTSLSHHSCQTLFFRYRAPAGSRGKCIVAVCKTDDAHSFDDVALFLIASTTFRAVSPAVLGKMAVFLDNSFYYIVSRLQGRISLFSRFASPVCVVSTRSVNYIRMTLVEYSFLLPLEVATKDLPHQVLLATNSMRVKISQHFEIGALRNNSTRHTSFPYSRQGRVVKSVTCPARLSNVLVGTYFHSSYGSSNIHSRTKSSAPPPCIPLRTGDRYSS